MTFYIIVACIFFVGKMKSLIVIFVVIISIYYASAQATTACVINSSDIVNITAFLEAHNQTTIQMVGVSNTTFGYDSDCLLLSVDSDQQLIIQVDDISTMSEFEGTYKASEFAQFLTIYNLTTTLDVGALWSNVCGQYLADNNIADSLQAQMQGTNGSYNNFGMSWFCLMMNSVQSNSQVGSAQSTSPGGMADNRQYDNSLFVQVGDTDRVRRNFLVGINTTPSNSYSIVPKHIFDSAHKLLGIHTHHPVHTHQRRPHFVYDILAGTLTKVVNKKFWTHAYQEGIKEFDRIPKERLEFFERLRYAYNHYNDNLAVTAPEVPSLFKIVPKYLNKKYIQGIKNVLKHEHMDGTFTKINELLMKQHYVRINSHELYKLNDGEHTAIRVNHEHLITLTMPPLPDRLPISEVFNPWSSYWDLSQGWTGFGMDDNNIFRTYHLLDYVRIIIWWVQWLFHIDRDGICRPNWPFLPNPAKCVFPFFTGIPNIWAPGFTPYVGMCAEFDAGVWPVIKGWAQLYGGSAAYNVTLQHPPWKPYLSWLVRYDNASTPTVPYIGDQVFPCLLSKFLILLLGFSVIIGAILFITIAWATFSPVAGQVIVISHTLEEGFQDLQSTTMSATFQRDLLSAQNDKMKYS